MFYICSYVGFANRRLLVGDAESSFTITRQPLFRLLVNDAGMEPLRNCDSDAFVERRASRRVEVTCEAVLETMTQRFAGRLLDMSEAGARLRLDDMPHSGSTALLRWAGHEAVCTVAWTRDEDCGLAFTKPICPEVVAETAALNRVVEMPIASVGNIAQGQRRSAFRASLQAVSDEGER